MATELPPDRRDLDERSTLVGMLDYYRAVLIRKAEGLTPEELGRTLGPSVLTIGGLVRHMARVEDGWFQMDIAGRDLHDSDGIDPNDPAGRSADELVTELRAAIDRSDQVLAAVDSLDEMTIHPSMAGRQANVRWVLVHMIEEYARHCGHADLLRESIDGVTGD